MPDRFPLGPFLTADQAQSALRALGAPRSLSMQADLQQRGRKAHLEGAVYTRLPRDALGGELMPMCC